MPTPPLRHSPLLLPVLLLVGALGCPVPEPPPTRHPTALPPQVPSTTPACTGQRYLRGGRWQWQKGAWTWEEPICLPRPATWRDGCVWERGRWVKASGGLTFHPGRLHCP